VVIAGMGLAVCGLGRTTAAGLGIKVVVTPASAALAYKSTQSYRAAVSGAGKKGVTWKVEPATGGGTVDGNGLYTAPTAQGTYTIVATSVADPTKSGRAHAVVSPPGSIDPSAFLPADRATA
jgi:hypothetical protein